MPREEGRDNVISKFRIFSDIGQSQLTNCNGLTHLLDIICSSNIDNELQRAVTFVLQCCLEGK